MEIKDIQLWVEAQQRSDKRAERQELSAKSEELLILIRDGKEKLTNFGQFAKDGERHIFRVKANLEKWQKNAVSEAAASEILKREIPENHREAFKLDKDKRNAITDAAMARVFVPTKTTPSKRERMLSW